MAYVNVKELIDKYHDYDNPFKIWADGEVTQVQSSGFSTKEVTILPEFRSPFDCDWPFQGTDMGYAKVTAEGANAIRAAIGQRALDQINNALERKVVE